MKKHYFLYIGLLAVLLAFGDCGKRNDIVWVYYDETNCADKWKHHQNNEILKDNMTQYYEGLGVRIYDVEIFFDRSPENCAECLCKTGRRFKAKIKGRDLKELNADGFYQ